MWHLAAAPGPGIQIATEFAPDVPPVLFDPNQLEPARLNLALNARERDAVGRAVDDFGASRTGRGGRGNLEARRRAASWSSTPIRSSRPAPWRCSRISGVSRPRSDQPRRRCSCCAGRPGST
jgi:hypothetical protein